MFWLKVLLSQKHPKDKKNIYLYHASPDQHHIFKPMSAISFGPLRQHGLYFAPSFKSLIQDWVNYVAGKKLRKNKEKFYTTLFIHKVQVPQWVLNESYKRQHDIFLAEQRQKIDRIGFWAWGEQIFIPGDLLRFVQIVDIKKYTWNKIQDIMTNFQRARHSIIQNQETEEEKNRRQNLTVQQEVQRRKDKEKEKQNTFNKLLEKYKDFL